MEEYSPQAKRLKEFIDDTGMNHTEFGRQCGFKSNRTMQSIYTEGKKPTAKALTKIVQRFPQLNFDWVLMGVGSKINPAFEEAIASPSAKDKSLLGGFNQIQKKLNRHDLNLNELSLDVEKIIETVKNNMFVQTQSLANLTNKFERLANKINDAFKYQDNLENDRKKVYNKVKQEHIELIVNLDNKRKEQRKKEIAESREILYNDLNGMLDKNWKLYKNKIDSDLAEFNKTLETIIILQNEIQDKANERGLKQEQRYKDALNNLQTIHNEAKASVENLGKFTKHVNPKPGK